MLLGFITTMMNCVDIVRDERRLLVFIFPVDLAATAAVVKEGEYRFLSEVCSAKAVSAHHYFSWVKVGALAYFNWVF